MTDSPMASIIDETDPRDTRGCLLNPPLILSVTCMVPLAANPSILRACVARCSPPSAPTKWRQRYRVNHSSLDPIWGPETTPALSAWA
jgi:hypothetical protein